jgi:hypothetical protein
MAGCITNGKFKSFWKDLTVVLSWLTVKGAGEDQETPQSGKLVSQPTVSHASA